MEQRKNMTGREIFNQQIAPLIGQIDAIAREHRFSYVAAVQYDDLHVAASCLLKASTERHIMQAWELIDQATLWETEPTR